MTDIEAAAERIIAGRESAEFLMSDARLMARVYLAERDPTPIDFQWAVSCFGSPQTTSDGDVWVCGISDVGRTVTLLHHVNDAGSFWAAYMAGVKLQMIESRGTFRRLATALGITLKAEK